MKGNLTSAPPSLLDSAAVYFAQGAAAQPVNRRLHTGEPVLVPRLEAVAFDQRRIAYSLNA